MKYIPLDDIHAKQLGRTFFTGGTLRLIQSGSGCEFIFRGRRLDIILGCDEDSLRGVSFANKPRIAVIADGRFIVRKVVEGSEERYTAVDSPEPVTVTVRVVKLSEAAFSLGEVRAETDVSASVSPTEYLGRRIEFIGDSITCGYGVDDSNTQSLFATEAENAMKSYGYIAAELLGAECSLYSYSGHGIISGWTETGERNTREILTPWYASLGFSYSSINGRKPEDIPWDFSAAPSDIVVVNVGTNDASFCEKNAEGHREFEEKYLGFLRTVRSHNPGAEIIAALGIMDAKLMEQVKAAAERLRSEGDEHIHLFRFTCQTGQLGFGSNWHPSELTQQYAAEELADFIRGRGLL